MIRFDLIKCLDGVVGALEMIDGNSGCSYTKLTADKVGNEEEEEGSSAEKVELVEEVHEEEFQEEEEKEETQHRGGKTPTVDKTASFIPSWLDGWLYVLDRLPRYESVNTPKGKVWKRKFDPEFGDQGMLRTGGLMALFFAVYASRMFVVPLWTFSPYIPVVCPIYEDGRRWQSCQLAFITTLTHASVTNRSTVAAEACILFFYAWPCGNRHSGADYMRAAIQYRLGLA
jgi:hypothetical protein